MSSISQADALASIQAAAANAEAVAAVAAATAGPADALNESVAAATAEEHPLRTAWAFWYDKKPPRRCDYNNYAANLNQIGRFNTVEGFWRQYVYLKRPGELAKDTNLFLFRDGQNMRPMWETFPHGGCWILKLKKRSGLLGQMWQDLLFALIGEVFDEPDVVGVTLAVRSKEDLISVWNADNSNQQRRFAIGEKLKQILNLAPTTLVEYKEFSHSLHDMSGYRNATAYVFAAAQ